MPDSIEIRRHQRLVRLALACVILALGITGLVVGEDLLVPLAAAAMITFVIHGFAQRIGRIAVGGRRMPDWLSTVCAMAAIVVVGAYLVQFVGSNIALVQTAAPTYERNLIELCDMVVERVGGLAHWLDKGEMEKRFSAAVGGIDLASLVSRLVAALSGIAAQAGLILLYVLFLLLEQKHFENKLRALFPGTEEQRGTHELIGRAVERIQTYLWMKTLISLLTGVVSYGIMRAVGVDYAEFWALVIFLLNYIPTLGSLVAVLFPTLLAAVQFVSWGPFLTVLIGLGATQFVIGNLLEPRVLGNALNLSPLAILLALALWGAVWGIVGMFLCVPLTMIAVIAFAHFEPTRPIAILLSVDGKIE
ncbi:MAG: AI-2 transport protein TqsA [Chlamydiales bacterium]|jgi:AI-2 transport protein TqsA